jgi:hypothetical protein
MGLLFQIYRMMQEQAAELEENSERQDGSEEDQERLSLLELLIHPVGRDKSADSLRERGNGSR